MNQYKLTVEQFILKEGCEQLVEDFYDHRTEFLLLPSFYTNNLAKIELPFMLDKHAWRDSNLSIGAGNTRELLPVDFSLELPDFDALSLRLNLIQPLKKLFDPKSEIEELLSDHSATTQLTPTLNSIRLIEATLPATLLQLPTTIMLKNEWMLFQFELKKHD